MSKTLAKILACAVLACGSTGCQSMGTGCSGLCRRVSKPTAAACTTCPAGQCTHGAAAGPVSSAVDPAPSR